MKDNYLDAGLPQHAVEIEAMLLSTYLANPTHAIEAHESLGFCLTKSDFYKPIHGVIYDAISKVYTEHDTVTPQLVKDEMHEIGMGHFSHLVTDLATKNNLDFPKYTIQLIALRAIGRRLEEFSKGSCDKEIQQISDDLRIVFAQVNC